MSATPEMPTIKVSARTETGKSQVRRLRAKGFIPAVAYGKDHPAMSLTVSPKEIVQILRSERGKNTLIKVDQEGGKGFLAMIKDFSYHPLTRAVEHVDLLEVKLDRPVTVRVPVFTVGKPVGLTQGGVLHQVFRQVAVVCVPSLIPLKLELDVSGLELHQVIATKDIKLPEGVSIDLPAEQTIIGIVAPEKDRSEDAAAATAAAAPAAAAKAAPAKKK